MGKIKFFVFIFVGFLISISAFFISPQKVRADTPTQEVVINEVYSHPNTGEVEWIEFFNINLQSISLMGYTIEDGTTKPKDLSSYSIPIGGYLVLEKGIDFGFSLNDPGDTIKLKEFGVLVDQVTYGNWNDGNTADNAPTPAQGQSIARIPNGYDSDNDAVDFMIQTSPTPGADNPSPPANTAPTAFRLVLPENEAEFTSGQEINFSWEVSTDSDGDEVSYSLYLGCSDNFTQEDLVVSGRLETNYSYLTQKICDQYFWQVTASDGSLETPSNEVRSFTLSPPVYSEDVIINEILPHPENGLENEFIELYNSGDEDVDLSGWFLDDEEGGSQPYLIPVGTIILHGEYKVFYKSQTNIALNDSGDAARLLFPDDQIAFSCIYNEYAAIGLSWARTANNTWAWTTKITPGAINIITPPTIKNDDEEDIPKNSIPIEIKTGEFRNYENYLVKIRGTVVETSGNTFYLDDGSGRAKVYIQAATGIDKPEMHKGDIFEVTGIVNLYRGIFRILPQKQEDIKLIQAIKGEVSDSSEATKTSAKKSATTATKSTASITKASSPIKKQTQNSAKNSDLGEISGAASPFWVQMVKATTGLAIVFLLVLLAKLWGLRKYEGFGPRGPVGGSFGDDFT